MALSQQLHLKQSQNLVMTQQLQQSIKLLQLSSQELQAFVEEELETNPLLARDEEVSKPGEAEASTPEVDAAVEALANSEGNSERESLDDNFDSDYRQADAGMDGNALSSGAERYTNASTHNISGEGMDWEARLSAEPTLRDHLEEQLSGITNDAQRIIGYQLIGLLDESGYLRDDMASLQEMLGADAEAIEATIELMQGFDPAGIFARDLKECLTLQLKEKNRFDPAMEMLLENLDLMANSDHKKLCQICEVDAEDMIEMLAEIRALNPKPATDFASDIVQTLIPDVFVRRGKDEEGEVAWRIELNSDALPRVLVNNQYHTELSTKSLKKEEKQFVSEQIANANWLVKALDQRANTILKTAREIVKQQEKFFLHGIQFLKPLTLKDVADAIEVHESTVSRVTTQKYLHTPRGIFEMKYFFTSGVSSTSSSGDDISSKTVMYHIKELIDAEEPKKILSDDKIVTLLKGRGVDVARRTVAKYREGMGIPSSVIRRRQKNSVL